MALIPFPFMVDGRKAVTLIPEWVYRVISGERSDHDIVELAETRFLVGIIWAE